LGRQDPLRRDDFETVADGGAAVRAVSDSHPSSSAGQPPATSISNEMMTLEIGPDSPTLISPAPRTGSPPPGLDGPDLLPVGAVLAQRYEILQVLGRGGMGAVYKARDREVDRLVALKVIRPDLAGNSSILERFKQELVLSQKVTHKNVVRIYDLGDADGMKFITMEYIEGSDLRSIVQEKKKFTPEEAVDVMLQVCRALEAAHGVDVIHRDLKPQNIMRDASGRVVVMDFGLARLIESNGMTQTGALVGTMEYMSPEQALGSSLDQRSDLFTLGLIFYELLSGKMPFAADSALASLIKRTQERAVPVSQHDKTIPVALTHIVSKCMERDPKQRYQNASELISDLEAWQGKKAGATLGFHASVGPWARTLHWPIIGSVVAVVVLALAGYLLRDKLFSSDKGAAGPQVSLAVLPLRNASGDSSLDWMGKSLAEMLRTDVGQSENFHTVAPERLHQILTDLRISADTELDANAIRRIAEFTNADQVVWGEYVKIGDQIRIDAQLENLKTQHVVAIKAEAPTENALLKAVDSLAKSVQENLTLSPKAMDQMKAAAFTPSSKSVEALRDYSEGLELARQNNDLEAVKRYQSAVVEDPNFALAYARLAQANSRLGHGPEAEQFSSKAVDLDSGLPPAEKYMIEAASARIQNNFDKALAAYDNLGKLMPQDPQVWTEMAELYESKGNYDKSFEYYSKVLQSDPKNLDALLAIGGVQIERGNAAGSFDYLNQALSLAVQLGNQQGKANVLQTLGAAYRLTDKPADALQNLQQAVDIEKQIGDKGGMAFSVRQIADAYSQMGKPDDAAKNYEIALKLETELGDNTGLGGVLLNYGSLLESQGKYDKALEMAKRALQIEVQLGDEDTQGICLNNIGSLYVEEGKYGDALTYFQRSLDLQQKLKVPSDIARSLNNLGETYLKLGKFDSALDNYLKALEVARGAGDKSLVALTSDGMARLFELQGRNGAALSAQQDAIKNIQDLQQQTSDSAQIQGDYGTALALVGRFDDAQKNLDAAVTVARSLKNDALVSTVLNLQGERLFYQGDLPAARSAFDQALQSASKQKGPAQAMQIKLNQARVDVYQNHGATAVNNLKALIKSADAEGMTYFSLQCSLYLGRALFQSKNYPQSQQTLEMVFRRAQDQGMKSLLPEAHYWLAQTLRVTGAKAEADIHMQQAQKLLQDLKNESHSDDILKRQDLKPIAQELTGKTS
jgi:tetratricopeptide (TPR) repeat protein/predicted Ser/Thr protein kinase